MLLPNLCICLIKKTVSTQSAFLILMYDDEILKPSNTGRLIADLIPDTFAYIWSRTQPDSKMLTLLKDPKWQPIVIFPAEYAQQEKVLLSYLPSSTKRPLFILLDGSWAQAKKMFRKSPYLENFPVLSFDPKNISRYLVRKASKDNQLATAEVAARALEFIHESANASLLDLLFETFKENYLLGKERKSLPAHATQFELEKQFRHL
ncbi:DTW domain-containing protein [Psychromonas sp. CNPT3]|nr:DTW domain-containing protein [Psychromonas sp. CNPT3]